jgi:glycosyltransferase involved in cell wall biosynthesis
MMRVALATAVTPRASVGMRLYARALHERLPRVAPDLAVISVDAPLAALPFALHAAHPQLVHLPYLENPPLIPRPYTAMVHDLIHLRFPQFFGRATALYWRFLAAPIYRGAARVLVSDQRVADDCVALLGIEAARIRVVPLGYDEGILTAEPCRTELPYLFYAGNHRPHKGLDTLYAAWRDLPEELAIDLVLTGPDEPQVHAQFRRKRGAIAFVGDLDPQALASRYRGALAYVQPSLAEGFGIPSLEAAVAGTPVIGTSTSVPAVVAPYAQTFAPGDVRTLAVLLAGVVGDPEAARQRAAEGAVALRAYTWDRFAVSTAAVFREVLCP